jgi:hypothetical protein
MQAPPAAGARRDPRAAARPARTHASRPGCAIDLPPSPPPSVPRRASLARAARCPRPATPGTTYGQHMPWLYQKSSEVINSHQKSSEVIRGHQRSSEVIRSHQKSSEVIRSHQKSSEVITPGAAYVTVPHTRAGSAQGPCPADRRSARLPVQQACLWKQWSRCARYSALEPSLRPIQRPNPPGCRRQYRRRQRSCHRADSRQHASTSSPTMPRGTARGASAAPVGRGERAPS